MKNKFIFSALSMAASAATLNFEDQTADMEIDRNKIHYPDVWDNLYQQKRAGRERPYRNRTTRNAAPSHYAAASPDDFPEFTYEPQRVEHNHYINGNLASHSHEGGDDTHNHGPGTSDSFIFPDEDGNYVMPDHSYDEPEPRPEPPKPTYEPVEPVYKPPKPIYTHHEPFERYQPAVQQKVEYAP